MEKVKASVIIRTYNNETTLRRAVDGALAQDFAAPYEIIIVDDGSTDSTPEIIRSYEHEARIHPIRQHNAGAVVAANVGLRASRGEYVALLDADDEYKPTFLTDLVALLDADPMLDYVYGDYCEEFEGVEKEVRLTDLFQTIVDNSMYRRASFEILGFYREDLRFPEYEILLRTLSVWKIVHLPKLVVTYHRRRESLTGASPYEHMGKQELLALYPDKADLIRSIRSYEISKKNITLRRVTKDDAQILFDWRNDEDTRKNSLNSKPIEWGSHVVWLEKSLQDPNRILVIAEVAGDPIGTCRADIRGDGFTEISYTIAPKSRGKGLSKPMVARFVEEFLQGKRIAATIKGDNALSESVVRALGMKQFATMPSNDPSDSRPIVEWR